MTRPREAARRLMRDYYRSRGEQSPEDAAEAFRQCVRADAMLTDRQVDIAAAIVKKARFDVDDLAENHLGVRLNIERLDYLDIQAGAKVFGFARPNTREITICERTTSYEPLYRTTVMHELGHLALHSRNSERCMNYAPRSSRRPAIEREADQFMVNTVLPEAVLDVAVALIAHFRRTDILAAYRIANQEKGRWQWREWFLPALINHLCVSRNLILIMLERRGLFTPETAAFHRTYRLETQWYRPDGRCPRLKHSMRRLVERAR